MDFYTAYHFLQNHKIFHDHFHESLDIMVVKVNPKTDRIDNDKSKNTKTAIWIETGPYDTDDPDYPYTQDLDLDCGGETFEEAIIKLAYLVRSKYGDG